MEQPEDKSTKAEVIAAGAAILAIAALLTGSNNNQVTINAQPGRFTVVSGQANLVAGFTAVNNANLQPNSIVFPVYQTVAGAVGSLAIVDHGNGTFTIISSNGADVNLVKWYVITPIP